MCLPCYPVALMCGERVLGSSLICPTMQWAILSKSLSKSSELPFSSPGFLWGGNELEGWKFHLNYKVLLQSRGWWWRWWWRRWKVVTVYSLGVSWCSYCKYREMSTSFGVTHSSSPGLTSYWTCVYGQSTLPLGASSSVKGRAQNGQHFRSNYYVLSALHGTTHLNLHTTVPMRKLRHEEVK